MHIILQWELIQIVFMDKHVDITKNMVINVADRFFHESDDYTHIERYVIHSIEYTDLNGKKCIYQS